MNDGEYVVQSCVSVLQLCAWGGAGTQQGYVKHMKKSHADGKSPLIFACQWGGCGIPTGFVKHMQSHHADGKSPALQNTVWMGRVWHMPRVYETSPSMHMVSLYAIHYYILVMLLLLTEGEVPVIVFF